jgi:F420-non-reducing hydrogenase iron-sulfur subunit
MTVKRVTFVQELLEFMGLGGRVHLAWISSAEARKFTRVVADFTEHIRTLGPNPLKAPDMNHLPSAPGDGDLRAGSIAK